MMTTQQHFCFFCCRHQQRKKPVLRGFPSRNSSLVALAVIILIISGYGCSVNAWLPNNIQNLQPHQPTTVTSDLWIKGLACTVSHCHGSPLFASCNKEEKDGSGRRRRRHGAPLRQSQFFDAEFERVALSDEDQEKHLSNNDESEFVSLDDNDKRSNGTSAKTLLEMSLDMDPAWKEARIPFVEVTSPTDRSENYIDGKLAFTIVLDGITYGIASPFDHCVALVMESADGSYMNLPPDLDENVELMEIMAQQLRDHLDADLKLHRTPRVLTISGDKLLEYTNNWQEELLPVQPVDAETLLDDSDEETVESFREFMRAELGEEEYAKTIREAHDKNNVLNDEIMELFNIPGFGRSKDDEEGIEKLLNSILSDEADADEEKGLKFGNLHDVDLDDGAALKLISYQFANGKAYSLVYLSKPYMLVGKYVPDEENQIRFELLSREEEKIIIPRIEELCQEDMERVGLLSTK